MTFGKMNQIKNQIKIALLLLIPFFSLPVHALNVNKTDVITLELPALLQLFSQQSQSTVDFDEERYAFYLDEPIKTSGYLQFSAPNKLYKFILTPEKISQKVDGDELEINNANQSHSINLNDHPEFSVILRAIISLLSGNHEELKKDFKIIYKNTPSGWTLSLFPHDSYILSYVESIKMFGNKNKLSKIIVTEPNNDRSITNLYNHR
jgi:hypothetical protein